MFEFEFEVLRVFFHNILETQFRKSNAAAASAWLLGF